MDATPIFSRNAMRHGSEAALPERVPLRAGPLTAELENGDLRNVELDGEPVLLRLYGAIRDRNWDTIEPRFTRYEVEQGVDGFRVRYTAVCVGGDVDFVWNGEIDGTPDGEIRAVFDGEARKPFARNRIGWCVLHPMECAGLPAMTETPDGVVSGTFPVAIMPWQPFFDMKSISHPTRNGGRVTIHFEGDLFEMEDQRQWTDASYKTYSTPLRLPYPVQLQAGDRVRQEVTLTAQAATHPAAEGEAGVATLTVGGGMGRTMPAIGLGTASHGKPLLPVDLERLGAMGLGHLRLNLDLTAEGWRDRLTLASREASAIGVPLEVELQTGPDGAGAAEFFRAVAGESASLARVLAFRAGTLTTTGAVLEAVAAARDAVGISAPVGGGSRAFFTEFNRATETLPLGSMEVAGFPMNPTVHAIDNASLMETIRAQAETLATARTIVEATPVAIGPITLRMPFNPNATGPAPEPAPGTLPATVDARQPSLFAAAWTAGSIGSLARAGVDALTYFQTNGWRGVMERSDHPLRVPGFSSWPGMVFPVYHVLADAMACSGAEMLAFESGNPTALGGFAARQGGRTRVVLANLTGEALSARLDLPATGTARIRVLDETTFPVAASDPSGFRAGWAPLSREEAGSLALLPYAVATVDIEG